MKRLIATLSMFAIGVTSTVSVVSCSDQSDKKKVEDKISISRNYTFIDPQSIDYRKDYTWGYGGDDSTDFEKNTKKFEKPDSYVFSFSKDWLVFDAALAQSKTVQVHQVINSSNGGSWNSWKYVDNVFDDYKKISYKFNYSDLIITYSSDSRRDVSLKITSKTGDTIPLPYDLSVLEANHLVEKFENYNATIKKISK